MNRLLSQARLSHVVIATAVFWLFIAAVVAVVLN